MNDVSVSRDLEFVQISSSLSLWRLELSQLRSEFTQSEIRVRAERAQKMPYYEFESTSESLLTADFSPFQLLIRFSWFHARRLPG